MPASLRRATWRSLGHLRSARRPVAAAIPSAMATPAASVRSSVARGASTRARAGASTTDTYRPARGGENHVWPRRPRPAVCSSATTTDPSASLPSAAAVAIRSSATSLVDEIVGRKSNRDARRPRRGPTRAIASRYSTPSGVAASEWFDFKTDVDRRRGMRQRAHRNEVGAGCREFRNPLERDTAGDFDLRTATGPRDRLADVGGRHVVDEDRVGARDKCSIHLVEPFRFDLHRHARPMRPCPGYGRTHAAGEANVVVLDQDRVEQADAMVGGAAAAHGVLLQRPQGRRRLARVENRDPTAAGVDETARSRRHAREPLQEVQRRPLADEECSRGADDLGNVVAGAARRAVTDANIGTNPRLELPERLERDVDPRDHAVRLGEEYAARLELGRNRRLGRHVAVADVLLERAAHEVAIQGMIQHRPASGGLKAHPYGTGA